MIIKDSVIRADRNKKLTRKTKGGDVLAAVNNDSSSYILKKQINKEYDRLDLVIIKNFYKFYVSLIYFPPRTESKFYYEYLKHVIGEIGSTEHDSFLILGDFNSPGYNCLINPDSNQLVGNNLNHNIRESAQTMYSFINEFKLQQLNKFVNGSNNTLDLFITKADCNLKVHESLDPLSLIDRQKSENNHSNIII